MLEVCYPKRGLAYHSAVRALCTEPLIIRTVLIWYPRILSASSKAFGAQGAIRLSLREDTHTDLSRVVILLVDFRVDSHYPMNSTFMPLIR